MSKKQILLRLPFVVLFLGVLYGCFNPFAPRVEQLGEKVLVVTSQESPEQVLSNFVYAYTFKDSLVYADLLDSSFRFVYKDPNFEGPEYDLWFRDTELLTTGRLFRNFETITLTWNTTIYEDIKKETAELAKTLQLNLYGPAGDYSLSGSAVFNFKKSEYDGKWRITRWKDESHL